MSRPTLAQIAQRAGVSEATASRVLRGRPGTSAKSRAAVERALTLLGFAPEGIPRPAGAPQPIAVIGNELVGADVDAYATLSRELNRRLFALGHVALTAAAGPALGVDAQALRRRGVAGAIVLGGADAGRAAGDLAAVGIPVVRVSNAAHADVAQFVLDASGGIETAVRHLVHMGHRRIGLALADNSAAAHRMQVFRKAIAQILHIPATRTEAPVVTAGGGMLAGAQAAEEILSTRVTAVISATPALTFGFLEATRRQRLRIPEDLSLLTVGDLPDADVLAPPISQVTFDWRGLAESAVAELERLIAGSTALPDFRVVPDLVLRASVRPVERR